LDKPTFKPCVLREYPFLRVKIFKLKGNNMTTYLMITGAAGGLGTEFALDCARRGYDLFLTDLRPEGVELASFLCQTFGIDARYATCDLTSAPSDNLRASPEALSTRTTIRRRTVASSQAITSRIKAQIRLWRRPGYRSGHVNGTEIAVRLRVPGRR
jgi:hypothetical protein